MHPASGKCPPVSALSWAEIQEILERAPANRLLWSAREKDAWRASMAFAARLNGEAV